MTRFLSALSLPVFFLLGLAGAARADRCLGPIARAPALYQPATSALHHAALAAGEVRITYIGHSTFTIESPGGAVAATDYNDYVRPRDLPDIATMNHAHLTHYTPRPDPAIPHVLRGWSFEGRKPSHDIQHRDLRVRNVPTNIRGDGGTEYAGNSIFIFEAAGLCIAHLGHLHHTLTPEHLQAIGQVDIVLAAVDGSWTVDLDGIVEVLGQLGPKLIIPMHYMSESVLARFLARMQDKAEISREGAASALLSRANLPNKLAIMVLDGR